MDLSAEDFNNIRNAIKARSGIRLADSKMNFLHRRLIQRCRAVNMETARDYYYYLKYDPAGDNELDNLIDAVAINETYFFREEDQLEDFSREAVPSLLERRKGLAPLTIWSAGCSTGEEAYTLAIMILEHPLRARFPKVRITASDISQKALYAAREATYDEYSVRYIPKNLLAKYFEPVGNGMYMVRDQVKQMVNFARINLLEPLAVNRLGNIDCIFCRNLLIYFDDSDKARCAGNLYQSLGKGGYLFLGHSESLARISDLFEIVRLEHSVVYRRPL